MYFRMLTRARGHFLGAALLLWPCALSAQGQPEPRPQAAPSPGAAAPATPALDSLRRQLEVLNREQMEEVRRVLETRQEEFEAIREAMRSALRENEARLEEARQSLEEIRRQNVEMRREAEAALQEALRERQQLMREQLDQGLSIAPSRSLPQPFVTGVPMTATRAGDGWQSFFPDSLRLPQAPWSYGWDMQAPPASAWDMLDVASIAADLSAATPFLAGQRFVAGVELTALNPSLARYFGVDDGVLVTSVTEGSPGARAGLAAGDVIVEVGGEAVMTVPEVRQAMSRLTAVRFDRGQRVEPPTEGVSVGVVREGERVELRIAR